MEGNIANPPWVNPLTVDEEWKLNFFEILEGLVLSFDFSWKNESLKKFGFIFQSPREF